MRKIHITIIVILVQLIFAMSVFFIFKDNENQVDEDEEWINQSGDENFEEMIFNDVSENHKYNEEILYLTQREIMFANEDGYFCPDSLVLMDEFIEVLARASMGRLDFENLTDKELIQILENNGIIRGGEITDNDLDNKVTNYQAAILLAKIDMKIRNNEQKFIDVKYTDLDNVDEVGKTLIIHCVGRGFFNQNVTKFYPNKNLTRAELARIVYLFVNK